jgi:hypothetical protein
VDTLRKQGYNRGYLLKSGMFNVIVDIMAKQGYKQGCSANHGYNQLIMGILLNHGCAHKTWIFLPLHGKTWILSPLTNMDTYKNTPKPII